MGFYIVPLTHIFYKTQNLHIMIMHYYHYLIDSGLMWWFGVPIMLIIIMSLYSQFRKRRSTEN